MALPVVLLAGVVAVLTALAPSARAATVAPAAPSAGQGAPSTYVVATTSSSSATVVASAVDHEGGDVQSVLPRVHAVVTTMDAATAARVADRSGVVDVEPDSTYRATDVTTSATATTSPTEAQAPWQLDRLDQAALPLDGSYTSATTGAGVTAYVIDSGIRSTQADLAGRVAAGYDATGLGSTQDCDGHGTHVAGLLGGSRYGVAKGVTLVPVRVLDCQGEADLATVLDGIEWVTAHHTAGTPAVANLSLGGSTSPALDDAVAASIASGITYAVAAGNDGADACGDSPADVPAALTVGATDGADRRASWSNDGSCVDLFAPGVSVTSDWYSSDTATHVLSGTSMATPLVAGAAALVLSRHPGDTPAQVAATVLGEATSGAVTDPAGAPDLLLATSASTSSAAPLTAVGGPAALPSAALRDLGAASGRDVARLSGADRYATAAAASAAAHPAGASRVYLASGTSFPDALAAEAAAGSAGDPVLLVGPDAVPPVVATELKRLAPAQVSVVGGPQAVSDAVVSAVHALTGASVTRLYGGDRYASAVAAAAAAHPAGTSSTTTAYLASGTSFADAVSASSAAALEHAPLLLTDPSVLSAATATELAALRPSRLVVVGGTTAVSDDVVAAAGAAAGTTPVRLFGADRYGTAAAVLATLPATPTLDVATGQSFPDALAGAAAAAASGDALVIVPPTGATDPLRAAIAAAVGASG